jgi:hypothetical protein
MSDNLRQCWVSFRSLPLWVQIWVAGILVPANAAPFFLLDFWSARVAAWAAVFVAATNLPIMLREGGMSRLMSIPHLLAWGPLELALVMRMAERAGAGPVSAGEQVFIAVLATVNGVSLAFDALDSWRWLRGERAVPGRHV